MPEAFFVAHVESRDGFGRTPLMLAAWSGSLEAMNVLLDRGADRQAVDTAGKNLGAYVARFGSAHTDNGVRSDLMRAVISHQMEKELGKAAVQKQQVHSEREEDIL